MIKNPLNKKEMKQMEQNFLSTFREVYKSILASGAVPEGWLEEHSHLIARVALGMAADKFAICSKGLQADIKNIRKCV